MGRQKDSDSISDDGRFEPLENSIFMRDLADSKKGERLDFKSLSISIGFLLI